MHPIAEFIMKNYGKASKIVEVGVGKQRTVLDCLKKKLKGEVIGVDIEHHPGLERDDIRSPNMELYRGADLIYSIRPPPELYGTLQAVAERVNADLIIRPLSTDAPPKGMELVNYRGEFFYIKRQVTSASPRTQRRT